MKKLASLLLALVMLISCIPAMAEEVGNDSHTITINNKKDGHIYQAYQIFTGDISAPAGDTTNDTNTSVLSSINWGEGVNGEAILTALQDATTFGETNAFAECKTAADVAEVLSANKDFVVDFATIVSKNIIADKYTAFTDNGDTYTATVKEGYYLIVDSTNGIIANDDSYSRFIIEVVEDSTVNPKSSAPSSEKKVDDKNDSGATEDAVNWQDSADYDIGDAVPFQLKATLGSTYTDYKAYYLAFHDAQSAGLDFNADSVNAYVDGKQIDAKYYDVVVPGTEAENPCTFEIVFWDLTLVPEVDDESVITVEYTATLNKEAKIGSEGNPNEMYIEFSNNPNSEWKPVDKDGDGDIDKDDTPGKPETGKTPEDKVIVFTYKFDVNKVTKINDVLTALSGAEFTLYKKDASLEAEDQWVAYKTPVLSATDNVEDSVFTWTGLDDGEYKLVETKAPIGYNLLSEPIYFTIEATHDEEAADPTLKTLVVKDQQGNIISDIDDGKATFEVALEAGEIDTNVVNMAGAQLPQTGGMGTTILYVGGGILVLAAIVLLIVKRRANAE